MLTRKQFIQAAVGAVAATVAGCGDSAGTGGAGGTGTTSSTTNTSGSSKSSTSAQSTSSSKASSSASGTSTGTGQMLTCATPMANIGTNHPTGPHAMTVSMADVTAGVDKIYDIMGTSLHTHSVTVTAAEFAELKATGTTMSTSTSGGAVAHTHVVTVTCAS